jgi:glycolate oxidase iron-sulfur subunit
MAVSDKAQTAGPRLFDLDHCVHCGLCLNACPTYRELGVEMDSPRGRIYQMVQVATKAMPITDSYVEHIDLCLACRACETACPSGVHYGRLVEAARTEIEVRRPRSWFSRLFRGFIFRHLLVSRELLAVAGAGLWLYQASGLQRVLRASGLLRLIGGLAEVEALSPTAEAPFFFSQIGKTFPAEGPRKYRVAFLAGCIANVAFARLNEATVRVLQKNGCEVVLPGDQTCCGALHVHSGLKEDAQRLARKNIDAVAGAGEFDAIITNAAGCGSTLKEYDELLEDDPAYKEKAVRFKHLMKDVTEFLSSIELNPKLGPIEATVTYQDSCHLLHGQKVKTPPRKMLLSIPGLKFRELPLSDICCGSAGIYNVLHTEMATAILQKKMQCVDMTKAGIIATANPGCLLQLKAGVQLFGKGQRVVHVVELLDESYRNYAVHP